MTIALTFTLVLLALVGYGLQRNARRQTGPKPPLAGSTDVPDRDLQRTRAELAAISGRGPTPPMAPWPVQAAARSSAGQRRRPASWIAGGL
jgi:hypothetical protein